MAASSRRFLDINILLKTLECVFGASGLEVTPVSLRDLDVERAAQRSVGNQPWK